MPIGCKLERTQNKTIRTNFPGRFWQDAAAQLFLSHTLAWACRALSAVIVFTVPSIPQESFP